MKSLFSILIWFLVVPICGAQTTITSSSGSNLYIGAYNEIQVISKDVGCGLELVKILDTTGIKISGDSCNYQIYIDNSVNRKSITIQVYAMNPNNCELVLLTSNRFILNIVPLCIYIGIASLLPHEENLIVSKVDLLSSFLNVGTDITYPQKTAFYKVKGFKLKLTYKKTIRVFTSNSNEFTNEMKNIIKELNSKDEIYIEEIRVFDDAGKFFRLIPKLKLILK